MCKNLFKKYYTIICEIIMQAFPNNVDNKLLKVLTSRPIVDPHEGFKF